MDLLWKKVCDHFYSAVIYLVMIMYLLFNKLLIVKNVICSSK